jgi:hypothetical protein
MFSDNVLDNVVNDIAVRKQSLAQQISNITCEKKLLEIENFIYREKIFELAKIAMCEMVGFANDSVHHALAQMVLDHNSSIDEKVKFFSQIINHGGIWDSEMLLTHKKGNIYNMLEKNSIVHDLSKQISKDLSGNLGLGPTQGVGEVFFALTGQGIGMATVGDLEIYGKKVELKTTTRNNSNYTGGRLYSNSGYGSNTQVKQILSDTLLQVGMSESTVDLYLWENNTDIRPTGGFNLNHSGLNNLSAELSKLNSHKKTVEVMLAIITGLYIYVNEAHVKELLEKFINSNGSFNKDSMLKLLIAIAHDYYQYQKDHDYVMYFNVENGNYVLVEDSSEYFNLLNGTTMSLNSHVDWNDDRSKGTAQIIKK